VHTISEPKYKLIRLLLDGLLQMPKLLLYAMCTVASLLVTGVITAANDRHLGAYNEHTNSSDPVPIDDRMDYIDQHNYAYVLKRDRNLHVANYHAKLIFHLELPDWKVEFSEPIRHCANDTSRALSKL